ncbi:GNAT family N-acetyltransferase [Candidatus Leptofilum sp.]|uniref:GNAT family N-acetyltransferase n=1 Tax=Candidatus Leptofilum sp. TaxID=3241576 RepID=UPI003B5B4995
MNYGQIEIRPFRPQDQTAVKQLILAGLADHWGTLDLTLNPDLNDIAHSYQGETFLLAVQNGEIVGCGALITENEERGYGRIVRMSVKKANRRQGIGQLILAHLETAAKLRQFSKIVLETTQTWHNVIAFYQASGYQIIGHWGGDTHFEKTA